MWRGGKEAVSREIIDPLLQPIDQRSIAVIGMSKTTTQSLLSPASLLWSKETYKAIAADFHPFHKHDVNVALHLVTTSLGVWGALHLAMLYDCDVAVYGYLAAVALTSPILTALLHSLLCYGLLQLPLALLSTTLPLPSQLATLLLEEPLYAALAAIVAGYALQDVAHYLCAEQTYLQSYIYAKPWMLLVHSFWLLPLVIDAVVWHKHCFLPQLFVTRNRCVVCTVANKPAIEALRTWIHKHVPVTNETTHVWPHQQPGTSQPTALLEQDSAIRDAFHSIFAPHHFDVDVVQGMNEIYVTAVGAKSQINSDAVFYTPHTDGPFWFLPCASLYRVLVGVTPNRMVRTNFNLQTNGDQILDKNGVVGFDYNRELHWIDHVPKTTNDERRSVVKLHFVVYPKGWHTYGKFVAWCNTTYNTWARGNFLQTLRPQGLYDHVLAWWIWVTTWTNALFHMHIGWENLAYVAFAASLGYWPCLLLTSFRHYMVYMTTFAFRQPPVAHGYLMRDAKLYKTLSMLHLAYRLVPLVEAPGWWLVGACAGWATTLLATAQLGMVRTYFGSELGLVPPQWIHGFPYNTIPHPMIVGQLFAFACILYGMELDGTNVALIGAHMAFYIAHMVQEMCTSSY